MNTLKIMQAKKTNNQSKKQANNLRNILAQPFPKYWPIITEDKLQEFKLVLTSLIKSEDEKKSSNKSIKSLTYGLNETLNHAKIGDCKTIIISTDLKPKYIIHQMILLTISKNEKTKIVLIPNLQEILFSIKKFNCLCIGTLIKSQLNSIEFNDFNLFVEQFINETHPIPESIITHLQRIRPSNESYLEHNLKKCNISKAESSTNSNFENLYLIKNDDLNTINKSRVFIPIKLFQTNTQNTVTTKTTNKNIESTSSDYISLKGSFDFKITTSTITNKLKQHKKHTIRKDKINKFMENTKKSDNALKYIGVTINKIQPNPNKIKKKKLLKTTIGK